MDALFFKFFYPTFSKGRHMNAPFSSLTECIIDLCVCMCVYVIFLKLSVVQTLRAANYQTTTLKAERFVGVAGDMFAFQRGPGDVLPICNGTSSSSLSAMSPQQTDGSSHPDSDAKKAKLDEVILFTQETGGGAGGGDSSDNGISRVVHLRNVPSEVTELELMQNFIHFGNIEKVLLLKSKNQGFLQFENEESAEQLVTRSANSPVQIRGKTIFCQYSNYQTLVTGSRYFYLPNGITNEDANVQPLDVGMNGGGGGGGSNPVLRVIIENQSLIYPISLDCLHQSLRDSATNSDVPKES
ncbi:hypothetical protein D918_05845 [Trichuris suis]|nr:hypothetical protein D918_05845 [Trichuris suis]